MNVNFLLRLKNVQFAQTHLCISLLHPRRICVFPLFLYAIASNISLEGIMWYADVLNVCLSKQHVKALPVLSYKDVLFDFLSIQYPSKFKVNWGGNRLKFVIPYPVQTVKSNTETMCMQDVFCSYSEDILHFLGWKLLLGVLAGGFTDSLSFGS